MTSRIIGWGLLLASMICSLAFTIMYGKLIEKAQDPEHFIKKYAKLQVLGGIGFILFFISIVVLIFSKD